MKKNLYDNEVRYRTTNKLFEQEDYEKAMPLTFGGGEKAKRAVIEDLT